MSTNTKTKRLALLENFTHYVTAFVIVMKGLDKVETPGKVGYALVFFLIGILIIAGTAFHHKAERLLKHFKAYVYVLEAVVMSIVGYLYAKDGKAMIQYVCFAAAAMFIVALVIYVRKGSKVSAHPH